MSSTDKTNNREVRPSKLNYPNIVAIVCMSAITAVVCFGIYYYIVDMPHCSFVGDGSYTCNIFASSKEKQKMCIEDSLMNNPSQGTQGYNANTGKSYTLSKAEQQAFYDFIVESCKQ